MNTNSYYSQASAISIPAKDVSSLPQPIDISSQRTGSIHQLHGQQQQPQHQQQHQQQQQHLHHNVQQSAYNRSNSININSHQRLRRESIAHSQGVGGISWGSLTIGSWLKDEVMMHNNLNQYNINPHNQHASNAMASLSPPIQSSYLPDLEANYCKDYSCCGELLPTLHDLLKHYEESHISPTPPTHQPKPIQNFETVSTTDVFINSNNHGNQNHLRQQQQLHQAQNQGQQQATGRSNSGVGFTQSPFQNQQQQQVQAQMQQQGNGVHNSSIHQQLRNSFAHTQANGANNLTQQGATTTRTGPSQQSNQFQFNNLPISSDFNNMQQQQQQLNQQIPITNASNNNQHPQLANNSRTSQHSTPFPMDDSAMDIDEEMDEGTYIDDPSRNLYVAQGSDKPFTCPVIGCNKNYKNQNGLKYHRLHGHQNQKLQLNSDGTYSVIDPNDGNAMEQDKPYRCEVCGKRYKNLNGLKYHRGHSTH